jgi:Uma2 family endonuclease
VALAEPAPHRFTVEEYYRMGETGLLPPDARVELIEGEVVDMTPIGPLHGSIVDRLAHQLFRHLGDAAIIRVQGAVRMSDISEPQPDVTVLVPRDDFYASSQAGPGDVVVTIEVSHSSLRFDRDVKLPLYARSGIPEMWIVDVDARTVLVAADPVDGEYRSQHTAGERDTLTVLGTQIEVADILGPPLA